MDRRTYLELSVVGFAVPLAGCASDDAGDTTDSEPAAAQETDESGSENESPENDSAEEGSVEGEPDVVLGDPDLEYDDSGFSTDALVAVAVENVGDEDSGRVELSVDWYDEAGTFLGDSTETLQTLRTEEVWNAQVRTLSVDAADVDDFELVGEFEQEPPDAPADVGVADSELRIDDVSTEVVGTMANDRDDELDYVEAIGRVFDDEGHVLADGWTNETDVPAGTDWQFEIRVSLDREDQAAEHEVLLDGSFL